MGLTMEEIGAAIRPWSERNFPANTPLEPLEGLIEELGELAHSRLKRRQGIRGTADQHVAAERDAIGDLGIYLLDFAWRVGHTIEIDEAPTLVRRGRPGQTDAIAFAMLARSVGNLAFWFHDDRDSDSGVSWNWRSTATEVAARLAIYAHLRGWDFLAILDETWARVRRPDWRKDPVAAGVTG